MEILSVSKLMHLTRDELCNLAQGIEQTLAELEAGTAARTRALGSLDNIRRVMSLRGLSF